MSNTADYIITTLSSGSLDYTAPSGKTMTHLKRVAPFVLAIPSAISVRQKGMPYVVSRANSLNLYTRVSSSA